MANKILPHSLDSERGVLGSILFSSELIPKVYDILEKKDFYNVHNAGIYHAIKELYKHNQPVDILTVREYLDDRGQLEEAGGNQYLIDITESIYTSHNIQQYARIVKDKAVLREVIKTGSDILISGYDESTPLDTILQKITDLHAGLVCNTGKSDLTKIDGLLYGLQDEIEDAMEFGDKKQGYLTSIPSIDKYTGGLIKGRTMRVSAYSNTGKSALSYAVTNSAIRQGAKVLYFSLEIPKEDLRNRLLSNYYHIPIHKFEEKSTLVNLDMSDYASKELYISSESFGIGDIERLTRSIRPDVVVIDYLQLVKGDGNTEYEQMNDVARRIRKLSAENNVAVFDLSQVSNEGKKYKKGDVIPAKGSGELIAAANVVFVMEESKTPGVINLHLAKNRHGVKGKWFTLRPNFQCSEFEDEGDFKGEDPNF